MPHKKIAIVQSNYIPWKGYFDMINQVDEFVLFDEMQFTKRDWRNRNKIKTARGLEWLSIPVKVKGKYFQKIRETEVSEPSWWEQHLNKINTEYKKAPEYKEWFPKIETLYASLKDVVLLSEINKTIIKQCCEWLAIDTKISDDIDYTFGEGKTDRLIDITKQCFAQEYISGEAAKNYMEEDKWDKEELTLTWMTYGPYPFYEQLHGDFSDYVSILDLFLHLGGGSKDYFKPLKKA